MASRTLGIILKGKDEASSVMAGVGGAVAGIGTAAAAAGAAIVAGLGAATVAIVGLTMAAMDVSAVSGTFDTLTADMGGSEVAIVALQTATRGMVSEADLMAASNKFLGMGLTDNIEETAAMAEMATQLGMAMGEEATPSMENFALMMANQSIPRLDSFGISSSDVRTRIKELMDETEGLSREQAFNTAVMELGTAAMERLGEQGDTSAATTARLRTSFADLKLQVGEQFIPVMESMFADTLQPLIDEHGPKVVEWAGIAAEWLGTFLPKAIETLQGVWDIMKGGFEKVVVVWDTGLKPALELLAEALGIDTEKVGAAVEGFDGFEFILGAVDFVVGALVTGVKLLTIGVWAAKEAVEWFKNMLFEADRTVNNIRYALERFHGWVIRVRDSLWELVIPAWLKPGSPSPLENAIVGITEAMERMPPLGLKFNANVLPTVGGGFGGVAGGGVVIHNHFGPGSVRSDADILNIADAIANAFAVRGVPVAL